MINKKNISPQPWENEKSYIIKDVGKLGKAKYEGVIVVNFCKFVFYLNPQISGPHEYRGFVAARNQINKEIVDKGKIVKTALYFKENPTEEDIKKKVERKARVLYQEHTKLLMQTLDEELRPEYMTLQMATYVKANEYVDFQYKSKVLKTKTDAINRLNNVVATFTSKPMDAYKPSEIDHIIKANDIADKGVNELHKFWAYCIDYGICTNKINPVTKRKNGKKSAEKSINELNTKTQLNLSELDAVFDELEKNKNGCVAGCALLLSGMDVKVVKSLQWKDLIFKKKIDYVVVKIWDAKRKGATHNLMRPLIPRTAEILRAQYNQLIDIYDKEVVLEMPIVSQHKDPSKALNINQVYNMLEGCFYRATSIESSDVKAIKQINTKVSPISEICKQTYRSILQLECNISEDQMEYKFLCNLGINRDTTLDNYVSMIDTYGGDHLYSLMAPIRKLRTLEEKSIVTDNRIVSVPETTRQLAKAIAVIKLAQGERIIIKAKHGVIGNIKTREKRD